MFARHAHVLLVGDGYVEPAIVSLRGDRIVETRPVIAYERGALSAALKRACAISGGEWRVIVDERFVYVTAIEWPAGTPLERSAVRAAAEAVIPEDLKTTEWDFRFFQCIPTAHNTSSLVVQVAALERTFGEALRTAVREARFRTSGAMPQSYALAALVSQDEPELVVCSGRGSDVLVVADRGAVITTEVVEKQQLTAQTIEGFARFVETHKRLRPNILSLSRLSPELGTSVREWGVASGYRVQETEYPLALGAMSRDSSGSDAEILSFPLQLERDKQSLWHRWWPR